MRSASSKVTRGSILVVIFWPLTVSVILTALRRSQVFGRPAPARPRPVAQRQRGGCGGNAGAFQKLAARQTVASPVVLWVVHRWTLPLKSLRMK